MVTLTGKRVKQVNNLTITLDRYGVYRVYDPNKQCLYSTRSLDDAVHKCSKCKGYLKVRQPKINHTVDVDKDSTNKFIEADDKDAVAKEILQKIYKDCIGISIEYIKKNKEFHIKLVTNFDDFNNSIADYILYHLKDNGIDITSNEARKLIDTYFNKYQPLSKIFINFVLRKLAHSRETYLTITDGYLYENGITSNDIEKDFRRYVKYGDHEIVKIDEELGDGFEVEADYSQYSEFSKKYLSEVKDYISNTTIKPSNIEKVLKKVLIKYLDDNILKYDDTGNEQEDISYLFDASISSKDYEERAEEYAYAEAERYENSDNIDWLAVDAYVEEAALRRHRND